MSTSAAMTVKISGVIVYSVDPKAPIGFKGWVFILAYLGNLFFDVISKSIPMFENFPLYCKLLAFCTVLDITLQLKLCYALFIFSIIVPFGRCIYDFGGVKKTLEIVTERFKRKDTAVTQRMPAPLQQIASQ